MLYFYDNEKVRIQKRGSKWDSKVGTVVKWCFHHWYIVKVDNTELLLSAAKNEMGKV